MIQRAVGLYARFEQRVHHALVEVEALLVRRSGAVRKDARPRHGKATGLQPEFLHEVDILLVAVVVVVRDVAGIAVVCLAGRVRKGVPNRLTAATLFHCAFYLVGSRSGTPQEACWKGALGVGIW